MSVQDAMESLIVKFHSFSGREGDKFKLNNAELKSLLEEEFSELITSCNDPKMVDKIMADLDDNQDGEVDFQEFVVLIAAMTVACNKFFEDCAKCNKDKQEDAGSKKN